MNIVKIEETILYEDEDLLVCHKPAGFPVQSAKVGTVDMESALKNYVYLKQKEKQGPYIGIVHRLDQPVEGIVIFGKNVNATKELNRQIAKAQMDKYYLAVVCGKPKQGCITLEHELVKDGKTNTSKVVAKKTAQSKHAVLDYQVKKQVGEKALVEIHLHTGRHHQIRVQMAEAGLPLWGDTKYNIQKVEEGQWQQIALCAYKLSFYHPATKKKITFTIEPKGENFCL